MNGESYQSPREVELYDGRPQIEYDATLRAPLPDGDGIIDRRYVKREFELDVGGAD